MNGQPEFYSEYEEAVLAAVLQGQPTEAVLSRLNRRDFATPANQEIFFAIETLAKSQTPVDILTVSNWLKQHDRLEVAGGRESITDLGMQFVTIASLDHYMRDVREKRIARLLYEAREEVEGGSNPLTLARQIAELCAKPEQHPEEREEAPREKPFSWFKDAMAVAAAELRARAAFPDMLTGVPSGLPDLDKLTMGFQRGDLIFVGARTSVGKTDLGLSIVNSVCGHYGMRALFVSLEMSAKALARRLGAIRGRISRDHMKRNSMTEEEFGCLYSTEIAAKKMELVIVDQTHGVRTVPDVVSYCKDIERRVGKFDLIILDHFHIIESATPEMNGSYHKATAISRSLKLAAVELDVPELVLCQLSRPKPGKEKDPPQLYDFRDSGSIEQDADLAMLLHRPYAGRDDGEGDQRESSLYLRKNRDGEPGTIRMDYDKDYGLFRSKKELKGEIKKLDLMPRKEEEVDEKFTKPWSDEAIRKRAAQLQTETPEQQQEFWDKLNEKAQGAPQEAAEAIMRNYIRVEQEFDKLNALAGEEPPEDFFADDQEDFFA